MNARTEEAVHFLIAHCAKFHRPLTGQQLNSLRGAHVWIPDLCFHFWRSRDPNTMAAELSDEQYRPLYDAAWELSRIGVLRPGRYAPAGRAHPQDFGDAWSITEYGYTWLAEAAFRPFIDM